MKVNMKKLRTIYDIERNPQLNNVEYYELNNGFCISSINLVNPIQNHINTEGKLYLSPDLSTMCNINSDGTTDSKLVLSNSILLSDSRIPSDIANLYKTIFEVTEGYLIINEAGHIMLYRPDDWVITAPATDMRFNYYDYINKLQFNKSKDYIILLDYNYLKSNPIYDTRVILAR